MINIFAAKTYFEWGTEDDIMIVIKDIMTFLAGAVGIIAVAGIIYGGIRYSLAMGDKAKVAQAIGIIRNCAIAIILAGAWVSITYFIGIGGAGR